MTAERPAGGEHAPPRGSPPKHRISSGTLITGVLALFAAAFVLMPFFAEAELLRLALRHGVELLLVVLVWRHGGSRTVGVAVATIAVLDGGAQWVSVAGNPSLVGARLVLSLAFFGITAAYLGRTIWTASEITSDGVLAAVAVYFLLGLCWGIAFGMLEYFQPGSFAYACGRDVGELACSREFAYFPRLYYFSFVTMTTLGYGDIAPLTRAAEGLSTMAAVTGQLFLAILIGRIVGMHISQRRDKQP